MHIYIDANIYLDYYRMSADTIVSLKKLKQYVEKNKNRVKLILPLQTQNEFLRNRNIVIRDSVKATSSQVKTTLDLISRHYKQKDLSSDAKSISKKLDKFCTHLEKYFTDKNSEINKVIESLFRLATKIDDNYLFDRAYKRMIRRNPPGKNGSIGDAVAWEALLDHSTKKPLHIISRDGDWMDEIDSTKLKVFLTSEWSNKSSKKIRLFKSIGAFLKKVPRIKINRKIVEKEERREQAIIPSRELSLNEQIYHGVASTPTFSIAPGAVDSFYSGIVTTDLYKEALSLYEPSIELNPNQYYTSNDIYSLPFSSEYLSQLTDPANLTGFSPIVDIKLPEDSNTKEKENK